MTTRSGIMGGVRDQGVEMESGIYLVFFWGGFQSQCAKYVKCRNAQKNERWHSI